MNSSPEFEPEQPQNDATDTAGEPGTPGDRDSTDRGPQDATSASWGRAPAGGISSSPAWQPGPPSDPPAPVPDSLASSSPTPPRDRSSEPWLSGPPPIEPPLFQLQPQPPVRIPHFGHLLFLLFALMPIGLLVTGGLMMLAMHDHLFGVSTAEQAMANIHYILGSEGVLYIFTFLPALLIFPFFWHESLLAGLQWNGAAAIRLRNRLFAAAAVCFVLALLNGELLPGPTNTPIEKVFRAPGAAWLLFAFGITFAPFFEEMFFRGFLLPSLCTAWDWFVEKFTHQPIRYSPSTTFTAYPGFAQSVVYQPIRPHDPNGHPLWSPSAMIAGSILTSIPFAWMHAAQTGYAIGPFLLLVGVSLVLCAVRLVTRSLACSVLVHASYNFLLFSVMLIASGGFRHLDKM
jgi:uncharacterized protein